MSSSQDQEGTISQGIRRTVWRYGKLGLLVDDNDDARVRVARELYGAEDLPSWWRVVRSSRCLHAALDAILQLPEDLTFYGIAVIDRYLLEDCRDDRLPSPWDKRSGSEIILKKVERIQERKGFEVVLVTSFPHEPPADEVGGGKPGTSRQQASSEPPLWKLRSLGLLRQSRARIEHTERRPLLTYGPEKLAPIATVGEGRGAKDAEEVFPDRDERAEARWTAQAWSRCIESFAASHDDSTPKILMTGAGASMAQRASGAGTPAVWKQLELALAHVPGCKVRAEAREEADGARERCLCRLSTDAGVRERFDDRVVVPEVRGSTFAGLVQQVNRDPGVLPRLEWRYQDLFDKGRNQIQGFDQFLQAFCLELYRHDHGFAHHHWLLARFPWSTIITTNFDGFHERAAFAAAQIPWLSEHERASYLRFASAFNPRSSLSGHSQERGSRLFKLYGNLLSATQVLAFSEDESKRALDSFEDLSFGRETARLIVVGHSMRDDLLEKWLWPLARRKETQLLWVDPAAFSRASRAEEEKSWWSQEIASRQKVLQGKIEQHINTTETPWHDSGPLPGRAIDFACDLWRAYRR